MAVYKVIQDIESEDKLLGPLTLKGLIYAGIAFTSAFIEFKLLFIGSPIKWVFMFIFAMPMILFGVLASPLGREQPTEVWLLSRLRFFFKPRQRIWDEEGKNDLVTITAPKRIEEHLVKDLSPGEVKSRLKTLALTLDTRGWAVKNVDVNLSSPDAGANIITPQSDRLVKNGSMPQQMPVVEVHAADDILDEKHNPTAQKFESMMQKAEAERRHGILTKLKDLVETDEPKKDSKHSKKSNGLRLEPQVMLIKPKKPKTDDSGQPTEATENHKLNEASEMAKKFAAARADFVKHANARKTEHPATVKNEARSQKITTQAPTQPTPDNTVTPTRQTVNMELAQSGSAFSVATLSQLANRQPKIERTGPNEVTISLH